MQLNGTSTGGPRTFSRLCLICALCVVVLGGCKKTEDHVAALMDVDANVRRDAARALGKIGDAQTVDPLIDTLKADTDWAVRSTAAEALGKIGDDRAVDALIAVMNDEDDREVVCQSAVEALGRIGGARAVDALLAKLKDEKRHWTDRAPVTPALTQIGIERMQPAQQAIYYMYTDSSEEAAQIGRQAVDPLMVRLQDEDWKMRYAAARVLGLTGDPRAVDRLISAMNDGASDVGDAAVDALVAIGQPSVESLLALLNGERSYMAVEALGRIGDVRAIDPLVAVMNDEEENIGLRNRAVFALGEIGGTRAIDVLLVALQDGQTDIREQAVLALERIGTEEMQPVQLATYDIYTYQSGEVIKIGLPAVELLIAALNAKDDKVRRCAAAALGQIGDARAVDPLIAVRKDDDWVVRQSVVRALGRIGDVRAVKPLIATFGDGDPEERYLAVDALVAIGQPAVDPLIRVLYDRDEKVRHCANQALGRIGDPRAVDPLIGVVKEEKSGCDTAALALGEIGDLRAVEPLLAALRDGRWAVRKSAARALGQLGDVRAVEPLLAALQDENADIRRSAAEGLGQLGDARAVDRLVAMLKDADSGVRNSAAQALGTLGDPRAVDTLIVALNDANSEVRHAAIDSLGRLGDVRAVVPLIEQFKSADAGLCCATATALGGLGDDRAIEPLVAALHSDSLDLRCSAATALGQVGDARAVDPLIALWESREGQLHQSAVEALGRIGRAAVEPLVARLDDEDSYVRRSAVEALGMTNAEEAVASLMDALSDRDWDVRCTACEALARIGDPAIEPLWQLLATDMDSDLWTGFALTLCGHPESVETTLTRMKEGRYPAEIRCLTIGWFGSTQMAEFLKSKTRGGELIEAARAQTLSGSEWDAVIQKAADTPARLEFTLSALSIVHADARRQPDIEDLCLRYIRRGDIRIIPQLRQLLNTYGTQRLAEDYLNCGQRDLYAAASAWGRARGLVIQSGYGSHRATWGSEK